MKGIDRKQWQQP